MSRIRQSELKILYKAHDIQDVWDYGKRLSVINHSQHGLISPNKYRAISNGKPCPYCAKKMVHGKKNHSTSSRQEAIKRGYEYIDKFGEIVINNINNKIFFHPNYVTLDHKTNKARCPEKMFDYDNLEVICWRCNREKGDNNSFELQYNQDYLNYLADEALARYTTL